MDIDEDNIYADGRLRWTPIDMDSTLFADGCSKTTLDTLVNKEPEKIKGNRFTIILFQKLWERAEFRNQIAKKLYELSETIFSEEEIVRKHDEHFNYLLPEIEENLQRIQLKPGKYAKIAEKIFGEMIDPIGITYDKWYDNMQLMKERLISQKGVLENGLAEYTSLEIDTEKKIVVNNSFDYYALFSKGFSSPVIMNEGNYTWTIGDNSELDFICNENIFLEKGLALKIDCETLQKEEIVNLYLNGIFLQQKKFSNGENRIFISADFLERGYNKLELEYISAVSPSSLGIGSDETILALKIKSVSFDSPEKIFPIADGLVTINLTDENITSWFEKGFSSPIADNDSSYVWTKGYESEINFLINKPIIMYVDAYSLAEQQLINVYINDDFIGEFELVDNQLKIDIGTQYVEKRLVRIRLEYPEAKSPKELEISEDEEILALRIIKILFDEMR